MCQRAAFKYCVTMLNENIWGVIIRDKTTNKLTLAFCLGRCLENMFNLGFPFQKRHIFFFGGGGGAVRKCRGGVVGTPPPPQKSLLKHCGFNQYLTPTYKLTVVLF